jgi:hypothetical protein
MTASGSAPPFVPGDFAVPGELVTAQFRLEPLGPQHNAADYDAWTSSMDHIRATPGFVGGSWPHEMTPEENLGDLRGHANDFAARTGFTYTVLDPGGRVVGCVYIYPFRGEKGASAGESASAGEDAEVAGGAAGVANVHSWVRADRAELDVPLYDAVSAWLADAWPFTEVRYTPRAGGGGGTAETGT